MDHVAAPVVEGAWFAGALNHRARAGKESIKRGIGFGTKVARRVGASVKLLRQTVDLIGIEHAVGTAIGNAPFLAVVVLALDGAILDDAGGFFTFAHLPAKLASLAISHPSRRRIALRRRRRPQHQNVDPAVLVAIEAARKTSAGSAAGPRLAPRRSARLDLRDDFVGNVVVNVEFRLGHLWPPVW